MAHVTFIHGIENKPPAAELMRIWLDTLAADGGIDLAGQGTTCSMVYWADVLYPAPLTDEIAESLASDAPRATTDALESLASAAENPEEARFLAGVAGKLSIAALKAPVESIASGEERIPLPWFIKRPAMEVFLKDVHHYLFNKEYSPRPNETYYVRDEIRRRFVESLAESAAKPGPHIVVSHSMGTVIAYDCLRRVPSCPRVEGLMTIGSPLGLDEIQDQLQPEWTRRNGFPERTLDGSWLNVFDPLDPVAGFDPYLADDYRLAGRRVIRDILESNWGAWRHDIAKYLAGSELRNGIRGMLGLQPMEVPQRDRNIETFTEVPARGRKKGIGFVSYSAVERLFAGAAVKKDWSRASRPARKKDESLEETIAFVAKKPVEKPELAAQLKEALQSIRLEAADEGWDVMTTPMHREGALLQSNIASLLGRRETSAIEEFPFDSDDTKKVLQEFFDQHQQIAAHPPQRPQTANPDELPNSAKLFLVSDFGTGLYGAPIIANTIAEKKFDMLLHLGDIYYSGQKEEVQSRFLDLWPSAAGETSRTLNGNHDMYSGGYGYFDVALPAFSQSSSYFAYQNEHWLLIMLDTAYVDNDIDSLQLKWINDVLAKAGDRRVILFSHHPLFSNFKSQGKNLAKKLSEHLVEQRITAWYWGHEHHAAIYDPHPSYGFHGRCLGNGGMPAKRKDIKEFPVEKEVGDFVWRRCTGLETPPALFLDGHNPLITEAPKKYIPHGFMTLKLDGAVLTEKVFSADGQELFRNVIK